VSIDPRTGYIRAMASSGKYGKNKFNYAAQGHRQPGSTAKVWVLMTALRNGVNPDTTTYNSHPLDLSTPFGPWKVQTYSHGYGGNMNITEATLQSDNTVYAQMDLDLGPKQVRKTAYDLGIRTHLNAFPAEGLGGLRLGVSPLEQTNAYATIASGGIRHRPIAIRKVSLPRRQGRQPGQAHGARAFKDGTTYKATQILHKNIQEGTGTAANIGCPAAGKTGTTDSFSDAWFVGFTPHLTTGVWVGYPNQRISMTSVHGISVAGGTFPRAHLARLHADRQGVVLRRLPQAEDAVPLGAVLRQVRQHGRQRRGHLRPEQRHRGRLGAGLRDERNRWGRGRHHRRWQRERRQVRQALLRVPAAAPTRRRGPLASSASADLRARGRGR
jgi:membrane peptidoglycan carboxypeptidase